MIRFSHIFLGDVSDLDCVEQTKDDEQNDVKAIADHQQVDLVRLCSQIQAELIVQSVSCMFYDTTVIAFIKVGICRF